MSFSRLPNSWPAVVVGLVLLIYWLRVLSMAARTRTHTGRAGNLIPPEPLGRALRIVWVPVVVLWVLVPLATPFLVNPPVVMKPLELVYGNRALGWAAAAVAVAALAATWVCWRQMGRSWRMGIDPNERTQLVFNGPYAFLRHPIYALSSLLMIATIIAVCSTLMVVVGAMHLLLLQWEARREERFLIALHGQAYADYAARVGRFLPRCPGRWTSSL